jgi:cytochrome c oxidase cbb3-type subunit 3
MRALLCLLFVVGCKDAQTQGTPPPPQKVRDAQTVDANPSTMAGPEMYAALCAPCHGKDLKGYAADNAPSLVTTTFLESATDDFLSRSIVTGRPGTSMAAYGKNLGGPLDDAAVKRLVAYLREQGPAPKALPLAGKGDPKLGEPLYVKHCATCHGDRTTRREGIHLANMMFQAQAQDPFIKYAIVHGRPNTKMVGFANVLSDAEIDHVVAFVRSLGSKEQPKISQLPPPTGKEPVVIHPKGKDPTWKLRDDKFVSVDDVAKAYKAGQKMVLIDARPPSDWMRAHITGAVSIPYHDMKRLDELPKNVWAIAYCACPHHLSGLVVDELRKRGHKRAVVLDEGINDWHRKGYPMTAAEGVTAPVVEDHSGHDHSHHGHGH